MRYPAFWQRRGPLSWLLAPLGWLVCRAAARRRARAAAVPLAAPVIVIGNITVGGTGKTPVLIALAGELSRAGQRVGIISRGYGADVGPEPRSVASARSVAEVGDEPWLIAQQAGCPVFVHPERRLAAVRLLQAHPETTVILSDDGLQHHRLPRLIEIVVVDGMRRFGNGRCLPAGPLREPLAVLSGVDFVLVNGEPFAPGQQPVRFALTVARDLASGATLPLADFAGRKVEALAGIGNPARFFSALSEYGIEPTPHRLADHGTAHATLRERLLGSGRPVLLTTKDAVKWPRADLSPGRVFAVEGEARLPGGLVDAIVRRLAADSPGTDAARAGRTTEFNSVKGEK